MCVKGPFCKENNVKSGKIRTGKEEQKRVPCVRGESICVQECVCEKTECTRERESVWERETVRACVSVLHVECEGPVCVCAYACVPVWCGSSVCVHVCVHVLCGIRVCCMCGAGVLCVCVSVCMYPEAAHSVGPDGEEFLPPAKLLHQDLPTGSAAKPLPVNAGDTGSIPEPGRPHTPEQPSPRITTTEPVLWGSQPTPRSHVPQRLSLRSPGPALCHKKPPQREGPALRFQSRPALCS